MARVEPVRLTLEDFKDQQEWIGPLFEAINGFTEDVVRAFSNNSTVLDNLYQEIKEIKWKNSTTTYPLKFTTKFKVSPKGIFPIYLYNNTLGTYSTTQPWVVWTFSNNQILISNISGLTADSTYTIRLLVVYG